MATPTLSRGLRRAVLCAGAVLLSLLLHPVAATAAAPPQQAPLRLSLTDALRTALEQNLDIKIIDFDRDIAHEAVRTQKGSFNAVFDVGIPGATAVIGSVGGGFGQSAPAVGGIGFSGSKTPTSSALSGATVSESGGYNTQAQVTQRFDFGLSYQVGYNVGRTTSNSSFTNLDPSWNNTLGVAINQPLLRGRGKESSGAQLLLARANALVSEEAFRTQVNTILGNVVQSYWEMVFSKRNFEVAERSLELAREQLGRTQAQVEVGMLAPVEETQAEVAVAQRRNDLIVARNGLANATDNLRALLKAEALPNGWDTELIPTESVDVVPETTTVEQAIRTALANRPELATARAQIAARRVDTASTRSALLPALDLVGGLSFNGIGGDRLIREPFPGSGIIETIPGGYPDAVAQLFDFGFGTWRVGVNFSISLGNDVAEGNYAQATLNEDKAHASLEREEQQAILEVRQAVRAVGDAGELVTSTAATRELAELQLSIEQDRFDVGMSTNFEVLTFQDDLARSQVQELRARIDYRKARAALARVTGTLAQTYGIAIQ